MLPRIPCSKDSGYMRLLDAKFANLPSTAFCVGTREAVIAKLSFLIIHAFVVCTQLDLVSAFCTKLLLRGGLFSIWRAL